MAKDYLTTTETAKLLSVVPDTVLKWVRAGKIKSYRTPGGHARIPKETVDKLLTEQMKEQTWLESKSEKKHQYCWEYLSVNGRITDECKECLTYKSKASRCYELRELSSGLGCLRIGCEVSCQECDYYRLVHGQVQSVLILCENRRILTDRTRLDFIRDLQVRFVEDEYECSYVVEKFRPDFIIIDVGYGRKRTAAFCNNLFNDPRVPVARLILASQTMDIQEYCDNEIFCWIKKPFTIDELKNCIEGIPFTETSKAS